MKRKVIPLFILVIFEAVAITLWLVRDNLFYLFNFSYIGIALSLGIYIMRRQFFVNWDIPIRPSPL